MSKIRPLLAEKFDISHKVLNHITDLESRHILFSIIHAPKKAQMISEELNIPISSVYKKIKNLLEFSLISEKRTSSANGRIVKYYQSNIKYARIIMSKFEPKIEFSKNYEVKKD